MKGSRSRVVSSSFTAGTLMDLPAAPATAKDVREAVAMAFYRLASFPGSSSGQEILVAAGALPTLLPLGHLSQPWRAPL